MKQICKRLSVIFLALTIISGSVLTTGLVVNADTYQNALKFALSLGREGDIILLSPASTSFDMFKNFEERGNLFKSIVMGLGADESEIQE